MNTLCDQAAEVQLDRRPACMLLSHCQSAVLTVHAATQPTLCKHWQDCKPCVLSWYTGKALLFANDADLLLQLLQV